MIYESLSFLVDDINEYFRNKLKIKEDKVVLSSIVDAKGDIAIDGSNKIVITLINVEKETLIGTSKSLSTVSNPLHINLNLMFSAYFNRGNYGESLRFLSYILAFFQQKSVFNSQNSPTIDNRIEKLVFELQNLAQDQLNNIWGSLGAKYMPCVVYKMRMLKIDNNMVSEYRPEISDIDSQSSLG